MNIYLSLQEASASPCNKRMLLDLTPVNKALGHMNSAWARREQNPPTASPATGVAAGSGTSCFHALLQPKQLPPCMKQQTLLPKFLEATAMITGDQENPYPLFSNTILITVLPMTVR